MGLGVCSAACVRDLDRSWASGLVCGLSFCFYRFLSTGEIVAAGDEAASRTRSSGTRLLRGSCSPPATEPGPAPRASASPGRGGPGPAAAEAAPVAGENGPSVVFAINAAAAELREQSRKSRLALKTYEEQLSLRNLSSVPFPVPSAALTTGSPYLFFLGVR